MAKKKKIIKKTPTRVHSFRWCEAVMLVIHLASLNAILAYAHTTPLRDLFQFLPVLAALPLLSTGLSIIIIRLLELWAVQVM